MRRSDRLARLQELLARVQRNTAERRGEVATIALAHATPPEMVDGHLPERRVPESGPPPVSVRRADREPIPPPPVPRLSDPDDWSSLLTSELGDPSPDVDAADETSFPSLVPPDAPPISEPSALVELTAPARAAATEEPDEPQPESQFERAMRIAAAERPLPPHPAALWREAAEELRERRITLPPEHEIETGLEATTEAAWAPDSAPAATAPPPVTTTPIPSSRRSARPASEPHGDTPVPLATFETTHTTTPREHESVAPPPMSRRRRALRPSPTPIVMGEPVPERPTPYWAVVLLGCGVGLLFTLAYIAFRAVDAPRGAVAQAVPNTTLPATATVTATATAVQTQAPSHSVAPTVEIASSAPSATGEPTLPVIKRPKDMGLLWVDSPSPVTVYVQGLPAGESGAYLEVTCGLKNVRLARRDLPPPGHSFPMWLGKAESVLVPCGAANRVKMSIE